MNKILIFAHYHRSGLVRTDTLNALIKFKKIFNQIIFISTKLNAEHEELLKKHFTVLTRENTGYDIFSYKIGIQYCIDNFENIELHLLNSSILISNPDKLAENYYNQLDYTSADIYGITRSYEQGVHLQSFGISFSENVTKSKDFNLWWSGVEQVQDKRRLIEKYEIGMSTFFINGGFKLASIFYSPPYQIRGILNPSHAFAYELFEKFGILKIEIIQRNPACVDLTFVLREMARDKAFSDYIREALGN